MTIIISMDVFETKLLNKISIYFLIETNILFYSKFKFLPSYVVTVIILVFDN